VNAKPPSPQRSVTPSRNDAPARARPATVVFNRRVHGGVAIVAVACWGVAGGRVAATKCLWRGEHSQVRTRLTAVPPGLSLTTATGRVVVVVASPSWT
jgi:hypothetical protein